MLKRLFKNAVPISHKRYFIPLAENILSFALLIFWNFSSAALRTSSPRVATRSG